MAVTKKTATALPTIDVTLCTIEVTEGANTIEYYLDTATKIAIETQTETIDPVKLIVKDILRAQKKGATVVTGTSITFTDNVFTPELVKILQGGTLTYDTAQTTKLIGYKPPTIGSGEVGQIFKLNVFTAVYGTSGTVLKYEKTTYPSCQGMPIAMTSEDGVFRVNEYTINSFPDTGETPYSIEWIDTLPTVGGVKSASAPEAPASPENAQKSPQQAQPK